MLVVFLVTKIVWSWYSLLNQRKSKSSNFLAWIASFILSIIAFEGNHYILRDVFSHLHLVRFRIIKELMVPRCTVSAVLHKCNWKNQHTNTIFLFPVLPNTNTSKCTQVETLQHPLSSNPFEENTLQHHNSRKATAALATVE